MDVSENPEARRNEEDRPARFPESLMMLAKRRNLLLVFMGIAIIGSLVVAFLLPKMFTANARILPPQQSPSISATAMLSELGPLGALAGSSLGLKTQSDLYVAMLRSRTVADNLIDRFSLLAAYDEKLHVDARTVLEGNSQISAGRDGVISISVDDHDPQRAADLANGYVQELERLTRTLAITEAAKRRIFFEREVDTAKNDLADAEVALKQTQEKTGLITLDNQSKAMIDSLSSLRARVATQEVVVQSMSTFATSENPEFVRANEELVAMRGQLKKMEGGQGKRDFADVPIENVPSVGLEYIRKLREVKYRETLFELLAKQYEAAKIDEARDAMLVQQLDVATPPERKSSPHRLLIVVNATILAGLLGVVFAFFLEGLEKAEGDPRFASRFQLFQSYLRGSHKL
ncbi:MAG TPA: Wzz/FepE/Etk N-terminal domain-containing protein [Candidatus Acidoferrales bacterium]|nr:Wzz/FepE/Etk N-terminal domain-containing protein [Candidatus Acidoferrales bacterium]